MNQLTALAHRGVRGIAITDSFIDRKLLDMIKENGCILILPMSIVTASYGIERSRNIYRMGRLLLNAQSREIPVSFVSMAKTMQHMNSYMQLIELAKLVGADERYATHSISLTNGKLVGK